MKKVNLVLSILMFLSIASCGQSKKSMYQSNAGAVSNKQLIGKWQSEDDLNYVLVFGKDKYTELYGKDTTDKMFYKIAGSCSLKDSSSKINLQKAFLLFYSSDSVQQCNEILNLNTDVLSWMNNTNGKIFVFKKIK